ncbi:MAG: endonuclease III, partial [Calditrichota bacterium]
MLRKSDIKTVLEILSREYGGTGTALSFATPFQLLISTMLAAQSTDVQVNKMTGQLYRDYPDARSFLRMSLPELEEKIRSIGLYRNKARNILATCRVLVDEYDGEVPATREKLVKLPGVGRKTAN